MHLSCNTVKNRLLITLLQDNKEYPYQDICENLSCRNNELFLLIHNAIINGLCFEIKKKLTSYYPT